jgi:hypothetical protein
MAGMVRMISTVDAVEINLYDGDRIVVCICRIIQPRRWQLERCVCDGHQYNGSTCCDCGCTPAGTYTACVVISFNMLIDLWPWHLLLDPSKQVRFIFFGSECPNDDDQVIGTAGHSVSIRAVNSLRNADCLAPRQHPHESGVMDLQDRPFQACLAFYCSIAS